MASHRGHGGHRGGIRIAGSGLLVNAEASGRELAGNPEDDSATPELLQLLNS
jgi:hypothetical protein